MLILSRKKNETIQITVPPSPVPRTIEVAIADIRGDRVRVGLTAETDIEMDRTEVRARKDAVVQ